MTDHNSKRAESESPSRNYFEIKGRIAETIVHDLAQKTFLTDWCYLNPRLPDGKELCDLLIIFDDIAIIWQIKDLKLDKDGKYKQAEVDKNIRQLSGARRQLFDLKTPIELENPRRSKEQFDPSKIKEIFLISVLLGESETTGAFAEEVKDKTVHVFTREFTRVALQELDTINDFCAYLRKKEALIKRIDEITILGGEEDLLAIYLQNDRGFGRLETATAAVIDGDHWAKIANHPQYLAKKRADEISYGWDSIVDRAHEGSSRYEVVARELARPNRFLRRLLSKVFMEAAMIADREREHDIYRRVLPIRGTTYCFLFADGSAPSLRRREMLGVICFAARGRFPENHKVIGVATGLKMLPTCVYDYCLLDIPIWTAEHQARFDEIQKQLGVWVNPVMVAVNEKEFPTIGTEGVS